MGIMSQGEEALTGIVYNYCRGLLLFEFTLPMPDGKLDLQPTPAPLPPSSDSEAANSRCLATSGWEFTGIRVRVQVERYPPGW
jgi:hypothetical protein